MELKPKSFALASAATTAIVYVACFFFVAVWPEAALKFAGWLIHSLNFEQFARSAALTVGDFFVGLISVFILSYAIGWLFARIYNFAVKKIR